MQDQPRAIVIRTAGINCDGELVRSFEMAGAKTDLVHLDRLIEEPGKLEAYDLIGLPGGFSHGDDVGAGRIFAVKVREHLYSALRAAYERGVCMIGVCNGFQVLVQVGLLPGCEETPLPGPLPEGEGERDGAPKPTVALAFNSSGRLIDDWPGVTFERESVCIWTSGLADLDDAVRTLPLASGEGRFVAGSDDLIERLEANGQVALRYASDINGSQGRIAGICDPTGRIFGLMPHPDRYLEWIHHPYWTRLSNEQRLGDPPGLRVFKNAVAMCGVGVGA